MADLRTAVPASIEHERLTTQLLEVRRRGQYLASLRPEPGGAGRLGPAGADGSRAGAWVQRLNTL
jgi:hypothetical protein